MLFRSLLKIACLSTIAMISVSATSADATTVIFNPGVFGAPAGYTLFDDFDSPAGQALVTGSGSWYFPTGNQPNAAAVPGDTTPYLAVEGGSANIAFTVPVRSFSFDYSTIDLYNTLTIHYEDGSSSDIAGGDIIGTKYSSGAASGSFIINGDGLNISGLTLTTLSPAFEVDNLATSPVLAVVPAVPEPATWAMMLIGMGAMGFAMRRRVAVNVSYA